MSIEAMKQALAALETCRIRSVSEWSVEDVTPKNVTAAIQALRTAIQQAGSEPVHALLDNANPLLVFAIESEIGVYQEHEIPTAARNAIKASKTYNHPATGVPGVPDADFDLICNAIDKADTLTMEGDYMLDSDDCIAVVRVMQALLSVHHGIAAAPTASDA